MSYNLGSIMAKSEDYNILGKLEFNNITRIVNNKAYHSNGYNCYEIDLSGLNL